MSILEYSDKYINSEKISADEFENEYAKWTFLSDVYEDSYNEKIVKKYEGIMYEKYLNNLITNLKIPMNIEQFYPSDEFEHEMDKISEDFYRIPIMASESGMRENPKHPPRARRGHAAWNGTRSPGVPHTAYQ